MKNDLLDKKKYVVQGECQGRRVNFEIMSYTAQIKKDNIRYVVTQYENI